MNINRENYEIYLVDFMDGTLSAEVQKELHTFLNNNPDIWEELKGLDATFITADNIAFPQKEILKQNELHDEQVFNETAVAYIENELNAEQQRAFDDFIENDEAKKRAFGLFKFSKLKADLSIVYTAKDALYRSRKIIPLFWNITGITAVAAALILAFFVFKPGNTPLNSNPNQVAQNNIIQNIPAPIELEPKVVATRIIEPVFKAKNIEKSDNQNNIQATLTTESTSNMGSHLALLNKPDKTIEPITTERDVLKSLKPKKPRQNRYILVLQPTLVGNNISLARNDDNAMDKLAKTGENILKKSSNINIERNNLERGVLNVLRMASNDKINYEINNMGKVSKINVKGNMLAFSLPIRNKQ